MFFIKLIWLGIKRKKKLTEKKNQGIKSQNDLWDEEGIRRADEARLLEPRKPKLRLHLHRYRRFWHSSCRTKDRQRTAAAAAAENGLRI